MGRGKKNRSKTKVAEKVEVRYKLLRLPEDAIEFVTSLIDEHFAKEEDNPTMRAPSCDDNAEDYSLYKLMNTDVKFSKKEWDTGPFPRKNPYAIQYLDEMEGIGMNVVTLLTHLNNVACEKQECDEWRRADIEQFNEKGGQVLKESYGVANLCSLGFDRYNFHCTRLGKWDATMTNTILGRKIGLPTVDLEKVENAHLRMKVLPWLEVGGNDVIARILGERIRDDSSVLMTIAVASGFYTTNPYSSSFRDVTEPAQANKTEHSGFVYEQDDLETFASLRTEITWAHVLQIAISRRRLRFPGLLYMEKQNRESTAKAVKFMQFMTDGPLDELLVPLRHLEIEMLDVLVCDHREQQQRRLVKKLCSSPLAKRCRDFFAKTMANIPKEEWCADIDPMCIMAAFNTAMSLFFPLACGVLENKLQTLERNMSACIVDGREPNLKLRRQTEAVFQDAVSVAEIKKRPTSATFKMFKLRQEKIKEHKNRKNDKEVERHTNALNKELDRLLVKMEEVGDMNGLQSYLKTDAVDEFPAVEKLQDVVRLSKEFAERERALEIPLRACGKAIYYF